MIRRHIRGAEHGIGLEEMNSYLVEDDLPQWQTLLDWLDQPSRNTSPGIAGMVAPSIAEAPCAGAVLA